MPAIHTQQSGERYFLWRSNNVFFYILLYIYIQNCAILPMCRLRVSLSLCVRYEKKNNIPAPKKPPPSIWCVCYMLFNILQQQLLETNYDFKRFNLARSATEGRNSITRVYQKRHISWRTRNNRRNIRYRSFLNNFPFHLYLLVTIIEILYSIEFKVLTLELLGCKRLQMGSRKWSIW